MRERDGQNIKYTTCKCYYITKLLVSYTLHDNIINPDMGYIQAIRFSLVRLLYAAATITLEIKKIESQLQLGQSNSLPCSHAIDSCYTDSKIKE